MFFFEPCNFTFSLPLSSFRRPKAVEQLEERIIVPEGTKILLKKVPLTAPNTKNTTAANDVPASNKRVRFSLPSKAFDAVSSDSEDENESSNPRNKRSKTSSKRTTRRGNKASSKGSDSEDEFTVENSSDVEEEEEEEEGGGGLGCSRCGAHQIQSLHEDEETGDMLCDVCQGASGHDGSTSGGAVCYHCKATTAPKYYQHKESGGMECGTCRRYRQTHQGELRPARLFQRKSSSRAVPAMPGSVARAPGGAAAAAGIQTPNQRSQYRPAILGTPNAAGTAIGGRGSGRNGGKVLPSRSSLKLNKRLRTQSYRIIKARSSSKRAC